MAVEYRLVNDNGVQKVIKLDITEPNKKGMPTDTTATIVNGDLRTIIPLKGSTPISAEEVSIEEWAPTYPGSPTNTWKSSTKSFTDEEIPNLIQRVRNLLKLPNRLQTGGWPAKFDLGGTVQQPESDKQKRMKELLLIINGAAKELSTKQPGDNVVHLAQVMQDPQDAELLEAIVQEMPDAQEVIDQVSQLSSQMFKCGGKTKKKVKKGAKGCVPCKKLMRVGGKLINVWQDCEGNIISKHQIGGRLIPKGSGGFQFNSQYKYVDSDPQGLITFDDITNMAGTENQTADYYDPTKKKLMRRTYTQGKWGDPTEVTNYDPATYDQSKLFKSNYDPIKGVFTDKIAKGHYNYGVSQTISDRASLSTSPLSFKTTTDASGAASSQMVLNGDDARLSWTPQQLNRYLRAKAREEEAKAVMQGQSKTEARQFRKARRDMDRNQVFGYGINKNRDSKYYTFEDGSQYTAIDGGNTYQTLWQQQNKADRNVAKSKKLQQKPGTVTYATTPSTAATGNVAASSTPAFSQTQQKRFNKQGGWLTKFHNGGLTDMPLAPYQKWITAKNDPRLQPGDNEAKYNAIGYGRDDLYGDNIHVGTKGEKAMFLVDDPSTPEVVKEFLLNNTLPGIKYRMHNHKFIDYPVFYSGRAPFPQALRLPTDPIKKEKVIKEIQK